MNPRAMVAIGVVAMAVLVTVIVAGRRVSRTLDSSPAAVENIPVETVRRQPPVPTLPQTSRPVPSPGEQPVAIQVSIEDLPGFVSLVSGTFPPQSEWSAFVGRADSVASEYLEKKGALREPVDVRPLEEMGQEGLVARAQIKAVLTRKMEDNTKAFSEFQKRVDALYAARGGAGGNVQSETFKAVARDLVHLRSNAIYLEDRLSKL